MSTSGTSSESPTITPVRAPPPPPPPRLMCCAPAALRLASELSSYPLPSSLPCFFFADCDGVAERQRDIQWDGGAHCERLVDADELAVGHADAELQRHVQRDERADGDIVADDDELKELQQHSVWECGADRLVVLVANIDADAELQRHVQRDERADGVVVANVYQLGHIERDERGDGVGVPDVYELGHVERDERADGVLVADDDEQQELQRQRVGDCCDDGLVLVFSDVDADADL